MNESLEDPKQELNDAVSPHSYQLCRQVRQLACDLRDKTEATPFAADTLILANEVNTFCDYVEQLHDNVETLLTKIETDGVSSKEGEVTAVDEKAKEIQREIHELNPTLKDTIKALFMWRDSPEERLRDGK